MRHAVLGWRTSWCSGGVWSLRRSRGCAADEGAGERVQPSADASATLPSGGVGGRVASIEPCPESGEPVGRGDGLPELALPCLGAGDPVQLAGLTGRPRLVNIWASWCGPCREEMPWLQQAHDTGEVDVLGVDAEDQAKLRLPCSTSSMSPSRRSTTQRTSSPGRSGS